MKKRVWYVFVAMIPIFALLDVGAPSDNSFFLTLAQLQTTSFRQDHDIVLVSLGNMALAKAKCKNYKKASQILSIILRSQEAKFGAQSQHTIETIGMIGFIRMKEMRLDDAMKRLKTVKDWQERNLPFSHPAKCMTSATIQAVEEMLAREESMWV
jgi:hypothetical protein